jgi:hypothetical protein
MDTKQILSAVKSEIARLQKVVDLLEDGAATPTSRAVASASTTGGGRNARKWTEAERHAMSLKQKARWAAKNGSAPSETPKPVSPKRAISAASRRKMATAQRARWAKVKSQKKTA